MACRYDVGMPSEPRDPSLPVSISIPETAPTPPSRQAPDPTAPPRLPDAYADPTLLGRGGMGVVFLVRDTTLDRSVALKTVGLRPPQPAHRYERFVREARTTARLQHPGIIAIHEAGTLPDGRPYFTMPEVRGHELAGLLRQHRRTGRPTLRALVQILRRATEPLAYAHARGVVHRDVKPQNIMVGEHGEVLVLDWGIARRIDDVGIEAAGPGSGSDPSITKTGGLLGTPAYMAPEQITGEALTPRADVHALGAVLYEILNGRKARSGPVPKVLSQTMLGRGATECAGPRALAELALACLATDPDLRPASAREVGEALQDWLDGVERTAEADALVDEARRIGATAQRLRERASADARQGAELLASMGPFAPESQKISGWELEDRARENRRAADRLHQEAALALWNALSRDPLHAGARRALADHYRGDHEDGERRGDDEAVTRARIGLEAQLPHLPPELREQHERYLSGVGRLSLDTSPPGARAVARPYVERGRRLVEGEPIELGVTPLDVPLDAGSWMIELHHPACELVRYPVLIERQGTWNRTPPGATAPAPIELPARGTLGTDERFVPAGWFTAGGDPEAPRGLPATRFWCRSFVMRVAPVTNAEWLVFLDDLVERGEPELAARYSPRNYQPGTTVAEPLWGRGADGRWVILPDPDGDRWSADWPVMMIDHHSAAAYATWLSARTGLPWRMPSELEWEKAARGVDRRIFPWGNHLDPTWAGVQMHDGVTLTAAGERPVDCSPYGVLQMAGCVSEWCLEARGAPDPVGPWVEIPELDLTVDGHAARGAHWNSAPSAVRCATRGIAPTHRGLYTQGFRLVRSWS